MGEILGFQGAFFCAVQRQGLPDEARFLPWVSLQTLHSSLMTRQAACGGGGGGRGRAKTDRHLAGSGAG